MKVMHLPNRGTGETAGGLPGCRTIGGQAGRAVFPNRRDACFPVTLALLGIAWIAVSLVVRAADDKPGRRGGGDGGGGGKQPIQSTEASNVPAHPFDVILGRPTTNSITASVLCYNDTDGLIAYGTNSGKLTAMTPKQAFHKGEPAEITLTGLQPDTTYFYQVRFPQSAGPEFTFHTARPPGSPFVFTIIADSHLDDNTKPAIYQQALANALADHPDFHLDLGDTFMTEKHKNRDNATKQYLAQRYYFGQLCSSAPLFFTLGNHDGESPRGRGHDADGLALWANSMRKKYFPNPVPDSFYTGDAAKHPEAGLLQDYYAWQWGDAQFIVLDPFWFTQAERGKGDNWNRTLGTTQYQWLKQTLESAKTKYKFIFIHHLVGGGDQCRGGVENAPYYEWGGKNADGSDGFAKNRPGWPEPIHRMLVRNKVSAVFHGHDHFYAKQDLDGIVYQEVPQPGAAGSERAPRSAADYGYVSGTLLGSSGHLRVEVTPAKVTVSYIRSHPPDAKTDAVADSYVVTAPAR